MTPRELAGWVPPERHEHYDPDGNLTGFTVVIRDSRIDDADRRDLLAYQQLQRETCTCGYHPSLTDPDSGNVFTPESRVCPVCAGEAQWDRMLREDDEKHAKLHEDRPVKTPRPADGRRSFMRLMPPKKT